MNPTVGLALSSTDLLVLCKNIKPAATGFHDRTLHPTTFMQPGILTILDAATLGKGMGFNNASNIPSAYGIEWVPESIPGTANEVRSRLTVSFMPHLDIAVFNALNVLVHASRTANDNSTAREHAIELLAMLDTIYNLHAAARIEIPEEITGPIFTLIHALAATITRQRNT